MANPLGRGSVPQYNNPANAMLQFMNNGGNINDLANQVMSKNPQASQFLRQMKDASKGMNPKDFAMQLAKQRGIDPSLLMQVAGKMGLK